MKNLVQEVFVMKDSSNYIHGLCQFSTFESHLLLAELDFSSLLHISGYIQSNVDSVVIFHKENCHRLLYIGLSSEKARIKILV